MFCINKDDCSSLRYPELDISSSLEYNNGVANDSRFYVPINLKRADSYFCNCRRTFVYVWNRFLPTFYGI